MEPDDRRERPVNYRHLEYFWAVARAGSLTGGARELNLTPQTVSGQLRLLEEDLGVKLFDRSGRGLVITEAGQRAFSYAEKIFELGSELREALAADAGLTPRLSVGLVNGLPKVVVERLLTPALDLDVKVRLACKEAPTEELLADLALHRLDVVLSDVPIPPWIKVRAFNHVLGESGVVFLGRPALAEACREGFPRSLDGAPMLLPIEGTMLRRSVDQWFSSHDIRPSLVGEFDDGALMKSFGQQGAGLFPTPTVVETEVSRQHQVERVGVADRVVEPFYPISVERAVRHPAVAAICRAARTDFLGTQEDGPPT